MKRYILQNRYQDEGWTTNNSYDDEEEALAEAKDGSYHSISHGMTRVIDSKIGVVLVEYGAGSCGKPSSAITYVSKPALIGEPGMCDRHMPFISCNLPTSFVPSHIQTFMGGKMKLDHGEITLKTFKEWLDCLQREVDGWGDAQQRLTVYLHNNEIDITLRDGIVQ